MIDHAILYLVDHIQQVKHTQEKNYKKKKSFFPTTMHLSNDQRLRKSFSLHDHDLLVKVIPFDRELNSQLGRPHPIR